MRKKSKLLFLLLSFILFIPSLWGLFHAGFFSSDDGTWMIIRLSAFYQAFASGQFPVRFLPQLNGGFGYPVADFLYPLFLYIGSLLHLLKIPFIDVIKILFGLSLVGSGVGTYLWLRRFFDSVAAGVGALVAVYFPYHIYDVYVRGSLGEVVALTIAPFIFLFIEKRNVCITGILIGFLILSHNTLALLFLPVVLVYMIVRQKFTLWQILLSILLGFGLSAFFWIPALTDRQFTVFAHMQVADSFNYFLKKETFGFVGWISPVLFLGIFMTKKFWANKTVLYFWILGVAAIFMATNFSQFLWSSGLLQRYIQFPFRFLSVTIISASFISAYIVATLKARIIPIVLLVILIAFSASLYLFPSQYNFFPDSYYVTNTDTTTVKNEYMPIWFHKGTLQRTLIQFAPKDMFINVGKEKGTTVHLVVKSEKQGVLSFGFAYFPGWLALLDGKSVRVYPSLHDGLVSISVPAGRHTVQLFFRDTRYWLVADGISLLTVLLVIVLLLKRYAHK